MEPYNRIIDLLSNIGRKILKFFKKLFNLNSSANNHQGNDSSQPLPVKYTYTLEVGTSQQSSQEDTTSESYTKLLEKRIIVLSKEINDEIANTIVAQLLYLESEDPQQDICLYINSLGGSVSSGMAIYDTMEHISPNISTICVGVAGGIAALLLAAGTKGKRFSLPNARIILCQAMGSGQVADIALQAREITHLVDIVNGCFAKNTGQPVSKIREDNEKELHMNSLEAVKYGLIDRVIDSIPKFS
jgi:ATP-dependent Clp protease, protease subunit